jgi:hypothetical protein
MELQPLRKRRFFDQSYLVKFDSAVEVEDIALHGSVLPFPTMAGLRLMRLATGDATFPQTLEMSQGQLTDIVDSLLVASQLDEVTENPVTRERLQTHAAIIDAVIQQSV